jgi:anti-sigma B factor antagonist
MQEKPLPYTDFAVHVAPTAEGGTDVAIFGELDLATVDQVRAALSGAIAAPGPVAIDLRACGFVDSRGIGVLVEAAMRLRKQGRQLTLRGLRPRVLRILKVAGLTDSELIDVEPQGEAKAK